MKLIAKQQVGIAQHHVMIQAPSKVKDNHFNALYESTVLETTNCQIKWKVHALELQTRKEEVKLKYKVAEVKHHELELSESLVSGVQDESEAFQNNNKVNDVMIIDVGSSYRQSV